MWLVNFRILSRVSNGAFCLFISRALPNRSCRSSKVSKNYRKKPNNVFILEMTNDIFQDYSSFKSLISWTNAAIWRLRDDTAPWAISKSCSSSSILFSSLVIRDEVDSRLREGPGVGPGLEFLLGGILFENRWVRNTEILTATKNRVHALQLDPTLLAHHRT